MSTRSILGLVYTLQGLRAIGEDPDPVLERHGLDPDKLDPAAEIDRGLELRVYTDLSEHLRDPLAGLKAGTYFSMAGYGPFTMLLMTCQNAWDCFSTAVKYQQLTYLYSELSLEPGESRTALVLTPVPLPERAFRFRVDGEMSGTYQLALDLQKHLGIDVTPQRVEVPYPEPPEAAAYETHYQCPVRFGTEVCRFWMSNEFLSIPFPTANATAHEMYRVQCDQLLTRRHESETGLAEEVRRYLDMFRGDFPSAAEAGRVFGLPERSFRRRLSDEGTSFRQVLEETRFRKARQYLAGTGDAVDLIAQQLGYAESAAFIHAFRRWAGVTPAAWRRRHRSQDE